MFTECILYCAYGICNMWYVVYSLIYMQYVIYAVYIILTYSHLYPLCPVRVVIL